MARVLRLPDHGRLLVCTDLQGCLRDFHRIVEIFDEVDAATGDAHLLFTGDLIHGPHLDERDWPDFLGEFYRDASDEVIDELVVLSLRHPGRIHALVGNHEHGHIGGPHTAKFAADEVELLEARMGRWPLRACAGVRGFALVAGAVRRGLHPRRAGRDRAVDRRHRGGAARGLRAGLGARHPRRADHRPILARWPRPTSPPVVRALGGTFCIYGHDVIPEGFERVGDEQMVVSTSFGVPDARKIYVSLDLGARYRSVRELRLGHEILPLYPDVAAPDLRG
jgi:hypothetical protein